MKTKPPIDQDPKAQMKARRIVGWLRVERRWIKSPEIEAAWHVEGQTLREMVNWLRCQSDPELSKIASGVDGYAWSPEFDAATAQNLLGRANSIKSALRGFCAAYGQSADAVQIGMKL